MSGSTRIERKYVFAAGLAVPLLAWLDHACETDRAYPGSTVSSIYWDTPDLARLREKRDGDYRKTKLRLRWYDGAVAPGGHVPCWLEIKQRLGQVGRKTRLPLSLPMEALEDPAHPQVAGLCGLAVEMGFHEAGVHVPMALIRYERRRYRDASCGARISVDTAIRCPWINDRHLPARLPVSLATGVLEIKTHPDPPPVTRILGPLLGDLACRPFSKYAACLTAALDRLVRSTP